LSISSTLARHWITKRNTGKEKFMKRQYLLIANLVLAAVAIQAAGPKSEQTNDSAAFARLKTLAGEWEAETRMGKAHLSYEVIAGGTALVEKETAEKMAAMLTVYHLDGERLLMTHYCMAGNQPRMQAKAFNPESGELEFQFLDAQRHVPPGRQQSPCHFVGLLRGWSKEVHRNRAIHSRTIGGTKRAGSDCGRPRPRLWRSTPRRLWH
jgi:hypothetical protein